MLNIQLLSGYSVAYMMDIPKFMNQDDVAMSLYIRDPEVKELAEKVMQRLGTKTKTEAVKIALENELKQADSKLPLAERIRPIQERYAALGPIDPDFDEKAFMDDMWEI